MATAVTTISGGLAPICLFTYNRLSQTQETIESLQKNYLASQSELFVFSDGWRSEADKEKVIKVREHIKTIVGFKKTTIIESQVNKGLANSIIEGVTQIINQYDQVIVVEDDLKTAPNFLDFMNMCLKYYKEDNSIISISGHSLKFNLPKGYVGDVYLYGRAASWGWATWKDRWDYIDWEVKDWNTFKNDRNQKIKFNKNGSDMFSMLYDYMEGKNNSWAIRFCYTQFKLNKFTIFPVISKIDNFGFGVDATNCNVYNRFKIDFDSGQKRSFNLPEKLTFNETIVEQVVAFFCVKARIKSKIVSLFYKFR
jgi:hypothetical protein